VSCQEQQKQQKIDTGLNNVNYTIPWQSVSIRFSGTITALSLKPAYTCSLYWASFRNDTSNITGNKNLYDSVKQALSRSVLATFIFVL